MAALLMGLVGFGLGLFFGWLLHRERVRSGGYDAPLASGDRATSALADASARLELADEDLIDLRSQLTDAQHLLDERAATIAQLEAELAAHRDDRGDQLVGRGGVEAAESFDVTDEFVDAAADAATAPDTTRGVDDFDVDETEVTDEVVAPSQDVATEPDEAIAPVADAEVVVADEPVAEPSALVKPEPAPPVEEPVAVEPAPPVEEPAAVEPAAEGTFVPPPDAEPDNLRRIRGIGPAMEKLLNEQGIVTYRQLAVLDDAGIDELQARIPGVPGRIRRDRWVEQAQKLHVEAHGDAL